MPATIEHSGGPINRENIVNVKLCHACLIILIILSYYLYTSVLTSLFSEVSSLAGEVGFDDDSCLKIS